MNFSPNVFHMCKKCGKKYDFQEGIFHKFFYGDRLGCSYCLNDFDVYKEMIHAFNYYSLGQHYSLIGCRSNSKQIDLTPGRPYELDLTDDIGKGKLVYINYTPLGMGVLPIEIHGNSPRKPFGSNQITLYPADFMGEAAIAKATVYYWYVPDHLINDISVMLMLDAFERYYEGSFKHSIVSAQSSLEVSLSTFLKDTIPKTSNTKIDKLYKEKNTFNHRYNKVLPKLIELLQFPEIGGSINKKVNELRAIRNEIIHEGDSATELDEGTLRDMLIGIFLAFKYFKLIGKSNFEHE
ncbi:HEPN domain-containing protein [Salicibibacter kimchii]|uniref:RiboL-PSP-HEPN domain-containing protein n=1 Tax=Salicibibacter kimchii TaxID=2099786 RepID=A0A345BXB3_9BACI|nr:hypothetical protein [Salicibibacter kimchii]AXF55594.1 hypothetical protein DT065_05875 [Salicibibacter kimchii]